jgi:UDP-glucose 4-epimerase
MRLDRPMIQDKKVLITGGAGFIGSRLANSLASKNEIVVFDDYHRGSDELRNSPSRENVYEVKGSILDTDALDRALVGVNVVIHCAAVVGINTVGNFPVRTLDVNIRGSANVLELSSKRNSIEQVICFSTSEIYGEYAVNVSENDPASIGSPNHKRWVYALSKLSEEFYARAYFVEQGVPITILRPFNVFGPGQIGDGAIKTFIQRALRNQPLEVIGDGLQIRSWCYVDDFVDATNLALGKSEAIGETFNIGNPKNTVTIELLAKTIIRLLDSTSKIVYRDAAESDVYVRIPNISKAVDTLGFAPLVDLEEAILKTAESMS